MIKTQEVESKSKENQRLTQKLDSKLVSQRQRENEKEKADIGRETLCIFNANFRHIYYFFHKTRFFIDMIVYSNIVIDRFLIFYRVFIGEKTIEF